MPLRREPHARERTAREGEHVVEMQRRRSLLAFVEILGEDGLDGASAGRVCKRAGISRRTFYELFDDREDCFAAVFDDAVERISGSVLGACAHERRWRARVRSALAALLGLFDEDPALARACLVETLRAGPVVIEHRRLVLDSLIAAIDRGREEVKGRAGPPQLTADSTVGGVLSVIHTRVLEEGSEPLVGLLNPLMAMIVHSYLGPVAARRELDRPVPQAVHLPGGRASGLIRDPFKDLPLRITFRTARTIAAIAAQPGASNREIGDAANVSDQGQISKLLRRLESHGLIENNGHGQSRGEPNAWRLTERGSAVQHAIETSRA
jgi:AcrR family transcriptional regulator